MSRKTRRIITFCCLVFYIGAGSYITYQQGAPIWPVWASALGFVVVILKQAFFMVLFQQLMSFMSRSSHQQK